MRLKRRQDAPPDLEWVEEKLLALLKKVESREQAIAALSRRLEEGFSALLSIMKQLDTLEGGEELVEMRRRFREAYNELFAIANDLESLQEEVTESRELLQRMLALVELLKERGARR